ncbi:glucoamylase family protein [Zunongwangia sp. F363]|uniref:Glucoamylase family protein n=1 Tax=Autumnicola tepida TaxID=3075595 RepID=A0ABU3C9Q7_9FLAO|nr:glucoamylase family protein [Zunongwangia sp. F363]MDT0643083.1 glucoamylase family protein [Zunongwangia sp. F363]
MTKPNTLLFIFTMFLLISCKESTEDEDNQANDLVVNQETELSDDELLEKVQKQTLKYFWDFAEPNSGMARERYHPDGNYPKNDPDVVTTGGTGFGLMAIVVGMEREYIPREEAVARLDTIADFLKNADRYHGAWAHWINGKTGRTSAFSEKDDGGDIVETSFLAQGFLVVREYLQKGNENEQKVAAKYDELWNGIEWNWYTNNRDGILWHWSPKFGFEKNFLIEGYNECLITYVMAASSPKHAIEPSVYHEGWARSGNITTKNEAYGFPLVLKHNTSGDKGGPLFWAHYSYLGLNPTNLTDEYGNYWDVTRNHSLINYKYCVENPENYETYSKQSWGLTASYTRNEDGSIGYTAHSPDNDRGVVSPTAAVSSLPYTPEESLRAMRHFYVDLKNLLWGPAGFYDAFSMEGEPWVAARYLAIDQGPQVVMIENYRSGLIWDLLMGAPEVQQGLEKLGFSVQK